MNERKPNADLYRLDQAKELLRKAGFIEQEDGTWLPADEARPDTPE